MPLRQRPHQAWEKAIKLWMRARWCLARTCMTFSFSFSPLFLFFTFLNIWPIWSVRHMRNDKRVESLLVLQAAGETCRQVRCWHNARHAFTMYLVPGRQPNLYGPIPSYCSYHHVISVWDSWNVQLYRYHPYFQCRIYLLGVDKQHCAASYVGFKLLCLTWLQDFPNDSQGSCARRQSNTAECDKYKNDLQQPSQNART